MTTFEHKSSVWLPRPLEKVFTFWGTLTISKF